MTGKLTKDQIEARMLSGEPFSYGQLCEWRGDVEQGAYRTRLPDADRLIDRSIQRLRRKGLIAFERVGGRVIWSSLLSEGEA